MITEINITNLFFYKKKSKDPPGLFLLLFLK